MKKAQAGILMAIGVVSTLGSVFAAMDAAKVESWLERRSGDRQWSALEEKWEASKAAMTVPIENLALPLDHYENGRVRALLRAQKAQILADHLVFAQQVKIEMFLSDGKTDGTVTAEDCLFNQDNKHGFCRGPVFVVKGTDRMKGRGMYFSTDDQFIRILSECEIRTFRIPAKFGRLS